ncbi:MAG: hypothetical protein AB8B55_04025 [Mariniblastus sp.]
MNKREDINSLIDAATNEFTEVVPALVSYSDTIEMMMGKKKKRKIRIESFDFSISLPNGKKIEQKLKTSHCGFNDEDYFLPDYRVDSGELRSCDSSWSVYSLPCGDKNTIWIDIKNEGSRLTLYSTQIRLQDDEPQTVYFLLLRPVGKGVEEVRPAVEGVLGKELLVEEEHGKPVDRPNKRLLKNNDEKKNGKTKKKKCKNVKIIVGYTKEAIGYCSLESMKKLVKACEKDISQSLLNSGINSPKKIKYEFEILPKLYETGKDQKDHLGNAYTNKKMSRILADPCSDPQKRFFDFHKVRAKNDANIVVLLTFGTLSHATEEFCVVDLRELPAGDFVHEFGHAVNYAAYLENGIANDTHPRAYLSNDETCCWSSISDPASSRTRLNRWSDGSINPDENNAQCFKLGIKTLRELT